MGFSQIFGKVSSKSTGELNNTNVESNKTTSDVASLLSNVNQTRNQGKTLSDILASQRVSSGGDIFFSDTGQTTSTTGGGTVSQTEITPEGLDAILQKLMGGYEGFTSIASGSKKAGVYGSTTEAAQSADFLSKIVGEVARIMSPTITRELDKTITQGARDTAQITTAKVETLGQTQAQQENVTDVFAGVTSENKSAVSNFGENTRTKQKKGNVEVSVNN